MMFVSYLLAGAVAGLLSGLLGIGGGIIIIPALSFIFSYNHVMPDAMIIHMAIGTSLASVVVTAGASFYAFQRRGAVRWDVIKLLWLGIAIGSIAGTLVTGYLPSSYLQMIFASFLFVVGVQLFRKKETSFRKPIPSVFMIRVVSLLIGMLSSLLGVGGGILLVPFLLRCQLDPRHAIGTSVVCVVMIGLIASVGFILAGHYHSVGVPWSSGYIYWPAFLGVITTSVLFAPMGVALAHVLPIATLKRFFAVLVLLTACGMLVAA